MIGFVSDLITNVGAAIGRPQNGAYWHGRTSDARPYICGRGPLGVRLPDGFSLCDSCLLIANKTSPPVLGGEVFCKVRLPHDITDTVGNHSGAVGELVDILQGCDTGQNQHGIHIGFNAGDDVRIHTVADKGDVLRVTVQPIQTVAQHQGVGLAHKISLLAGGQLNGSDQRAGGG